MKPKKAHKKEKISIPSASSTTNYLQSTYQLYAISIPITCKVHYNFWSMESQIKIFLQKRVSNCKYDWGNKYALQ